MPLKFHCNIENMSKSWFEFNFSLAQILPTDDLVNNWLYRSRGDGDQFPESLLRTTSTYERQRSLASRVRLRVRVGQNFLGRFFLLKYVEIPWISRKMEVVVGFNSFNSGDCWSDFIDSSSHSEMVIWTPSTPASWSHFGQQQALPR